MSKKRNPSTKSTRLALRREVLRNLSTDDLARAGGGIYVEDPTSLLAWLGGERAAGHCRASQ